MEGRRSCTGREVSRSESPFASASDCCLMSLERDRMRRCLFAMEAVILVSAALLQGCSSQTKEDQVDTWLLRSPNPSNYNASGLPSYHTWEEWAEAGRRIEGVEAVLINMLQQKPPNWVVAEALGYVGSERCVPFLIAALKERDASFAGRAAHTLGILGSPTAVEPLCVLASKPLPPKAADESSPEAIERSDAWMVKFNAVGALGLIGDRRASPCLRRILENETLDPLDKDFVLEQLGKIESPARGP